VHDGVWTPLAEEPRQATATDVAALESRGAIDELAAPGAQIVDDANLVVLLEEPIDDVRADESGPAGDKDFHRASRRGIAHSVDHDVRRISTAAGDWRSERRAVLRSETMVATKKRILIVDDEPLIIEVLSEHFKEAYDIETAMNGTDALAAVVRQRPDLMLLDINMPRMNGVEVLKDVKKIDESIAVIMVTANEQVSLAADALKSGAFGYVPKPFDFRYLDHMVATIFDALAPRRR
jgi:two-component system response regulator (stage 0 sporulation protein F)